MGNQIPQAPESCKSVVSLFDESGNMARPWARAGYHCYCFDILNHHRAVEEHFDGGGFIAYVEADLDDPAWMEAFRSIAPRIAFSFSPCDDLAVCGAGHFQRKLAENPDCQKIAVARARLVETVGNELGIPWMHENPVSMLSSMWRPADFYFNPSDYGGYLPEDDVHPRWPEYIAPRDAYPKKTGLRYGNGFRVPFMKKVARAPGYSTQHKKLGGKSAKTKQIRSETPRGFAMAVFEANST